MSAVSFKNRVVIVTGSGGGLGRTYALEIARRGGAVVVNDLGGTVEGSGASSTMADQVVNEIKAAGGQAVANYDNVATTDGARRIAATALDTFGRIDALINNAGNFRASWFEDYTKEDLESLITTHLIGTFNVTQAVWPHMKAQHYGRIVFTSSSAGLFGHEKLSAYGAAKGGVAALMNVLSEEGESHGILCNGLMPNASGRMTLRAGEKMSPEDAKEAMANAAGIGNSMEPIFNTGIAVYLASEDCRSTHSLYSACRGRIARVFIGVTNGWQGSCEQPSTVEDIAAHFDQIRDLTHGFHTPRSPSEEHSIVASQVAAGT